MSFFLTFNVCYVCCCFNSKFKLKTISAKALGEGWCSIIYCSYDCFVIISAFKNTNNNLSVCFPAGMMGRIIILTLHPPTYEIFTMVSRVLLISSGRMMYSGRRRDLLPYFATADYPCPAFKNPSDYYCKFSLHFTN